MRRATAVAGQAVGGAPGGAVGWETAVAGQADGGAPGGAVGWETAVAGQCLGLLVRLHHHKLMP